jgi:lipopolysaccharide export system permease protein
MILFIYILRTYFRFVVTTIFLTLFLFVLFDFIHKSTTYFAAHNPDPLAILKYYAAQLPFQIMQALPIGSLLASVITMVLLNRGNEITAMRAAGLSPVRIALPLACGGLLLSLLQFLIGDFVIPKSAVYMHYTRKVLIEGEKSFYSTKESHWVRNSNQILYFHTYNPEFKTLEKVKLIQLGPQFKPEKMIKANFAHYLPHYDYWELVDADIFNFARDGKLLSRDSTPRMTLFLPLETEKLYNDVRSADEMSTRELFDKIGSGRKYGGDVLSMEIAWHVKWAYALAAFVVSLIGLQFGYQSERATETVRSVILAFSFGISYWFILSASRALAASGNLNPFIAAWLANVIILSLMGVQIWRISRSIR